MFKIIPGIWSSYVNETFFIASKSMLHNKDPGTLIAALDERNQRKLYTALSHTVCRAYIQSIKTRAGGKRSVTAPYSSTGYEIYNRKRNL